MNKYSVCLHGHATSVSLEAEFWAQICRIAEARQQSVASLISEIDDERDTKSGTGLSGALRLFVLNDLLARQSGK
ncbi:MAG: ribbon-helix-helix domain-containing protein [Candidatus Puniceispirillaceae bacterium]